MNIVTNGTKAQGKTIGVKHQDYTTYKDFTSNKSLASADLKHHLVEQLKFSHIGVEISILMLFYSKLTLHHIKKQNQC